MFHCIKHPIQTDIYLTSFGIEKVSFIDKNTTMDASAMGESINFDYNWDNLSVGNLHANQSGNFFGKSFWLNNILNRIILNEI